MRGVEGGAGVVRLREVGGGGKGGARGFEVVNRVIRCWRRRAGGRGGFLLADAAFVAAFVGGV